MSNQAIPLLLEEWENNSTDAGTSSCTTVLKPEDGSEDQHCETQYDKGMVARKNDEMLKWRDVVSSPLSYPLTLTTEKDRAQTLDSYSYYPSFSPCLAVNKSLHGLGLTVAVERAKTLERCRKKCAGLLQHVASAHESLANNLLQSDVINNKQDTISEYHLVALQQGLLSWAKKQHMESAKLKHDICRSLEDGVGLSQSATPGWTLYSNYSSEKDSCQKIHHEVKRAKRKYVKQLQETQRHLDVYRSQNLKGQNSSKEKDESKGTENQSDTRDETKSVSKAASTTNYKNKLASSKALWSELKELRVKQNSYLCKRQEEIKQIEFVTTVEKSSLDELQQAELKRAQFFLETLEKVLSNSTYSAHATLASTYFKEALIVSNGNEDKIGDSVPKLRVVASSDGEAPWLAAFPKKTLENFHDGDSAPLRQRCNTAPTGSSTRNVTVSILPSPSTPLKDSQAKDRTVFSPQSSTPPPPEQLKRSSSSADNASKAESQASKPPPADNTISAAVAQSIALHLPEEAGLLRDTLQEQILIRDQRYQEAKAALQIVDLLISAFDGYASTLRGRLAHEGYSISCNAVLLPSQLNKNPSLNTDFNSRSSTLPPPSASSDSVFMTPNNRNRTSSANSHDSGKSGASNITPPSPADGNNISSSSLFTTSSNMGGIGNNVEPLSSLLKAVEGPNALKCWGALMESMAQSVHASAMLTQSLRQFKSQVLQKYVTTLQKNAKSFRESEDMRWKHLIEAAQIEVRQKSKLTQTTLELQKATERLEALQQEVPTKESDKVAVDMTPTMRKALGSMFSILPGGGEEAMAKMLSLKQRVEIAKLNFKDLNEKAARDKELLQDASRKKFQSFTSYTAAAKALEATFAKDEKDARNSLIEACHSIRKYFRAFFVHRSHSLAAAFTVLGISEQRTREFILDIGLANMEGRYTMSFGGEDDDEGLEVNYTEDEDDEEDFINEMKAKENEKKIVESMSSIKEVVNNRYEAIIKQDMNLWAIQLKSKIDQHRQASSGMIGSTKDDVNMSSMLEEDVLKNPLLDSIILSELLFLVESKKIPKINEPAKQIASNKQEGSTEGHRSEFSVNQNTSERFLIFLSVCFFNPLNARQLRLSIFETPPSDLVELAVTLNREITQHAVEVVAVAETASERTSILATKAQETFLTHFWNNPEDRHQDDQEEGQNNIKVPPTVIQSYSCAFWPRTDERGLSPLLHGRMFCTSSKMYFVGWGGKKIVLRWSDVVSVHKDTTVNGIVDNALRIVMADSEEYDSSYFFGSFAFRDQAHGLLQRLVTVANSLQEIDGKIEEKIIREVQDINESQPEKSVIKPKRRNNKRQASMKPVPPDHVLNKMEQLVSDKIDNVTVKDYYKYIWSEGNGSTDDVSPFYYSWLVDCSNHEIKVSEWEYGTFKKDWCGETYTQRRTVTYKYTRTTHLYVGPPTADVTQTHYCRVEGHQDGPGDKCVLSMTTKMDGIPNADTFVVEIRWVGRRVGAQNLQLDAGVFVDFKRSSMFAKQIRNGTMEESKPTHANLLQCVKKTLTNLPALSINTSETLEEEQQVEEEGESLIEESSIMPEKSVWEHIPLKINKDLQGSNGSHHDKMIRKLNRELQGFNESLDEKSMRKPISLKFNKEVQALNKSQDEMSMRKPKKCNNKRHASMKPVPPDHVLNKMEQLVSDKIDNVTVKDYYKYIWSEGNGSTDDVSPFYYSWLVDCSNHEIKVSEWEYGTFKKDWCGETYTQRRTVTYKYTRTTHLYVGPPTADVTQTHYCRVEGHQDGPGDKCVLSMTTKMEGIPYADTFVVEIRWVGRRVGAQNLQLDAGVFVDFKRSSMFAKQIRNGTIEESKRTHANVLQCVKKTLTRFVQPSHVIRLQRVQKTRNNVREKKTYRYILTRLASKIRSEHPSQLLTENPTTYPFAFALLVIFIVILNCVETRTNN